MTLRSRVTAAAAVAVLVSVIGVSVAVYVSTADELRRQVDVTLREQGDRLAVAPQLPAIPPPTTPISGEPDAALFTDSYVQVLDDDGDVLWSGGIELPITEATRSVVRGDVRSSFETISVDSDRVRVYDVAAAPGTVRFGRSLEEVDRSLDRLAVRIAVVGLVGLLLAAVLGWLIASRAIAPVQRLSEAARGIKRTGDVTGRLPVQGRDEVASMGRSFNEVLDALESSQTSQRQLVADASHELRTPLTTLRTNVEVLARGYGLPPDERDRILEDVTGQLQDLTELVEDLVDLARGEAAESVSEPVDLGDVVSDVLDRARRQRPSLTFTLERMPTLVMAPPDRVDRAVSNLVDNAAKWSPVQGIVHVRVADGAVEVTDSGPGIAPEDLPHIFDRFYRSATARKMQGSGLGLAIVKQIADSLGGSVTVRMDERGTTFRLHLPVLDGEVGGLDGGPIGRGTER